MTRAIVMIIAVWAMVVASRASQKALNAGMRNGSGSSLMRRRRSGTPGPVQPE